jgi:hypothetical protein
VAPGGVLVVETAVGETAVEDADGPVPEGCERRMVGVPGVPVGVVEGAGPRRRGEARKGPQVDRVSEAHVAGVASEHDALGARRAGDRRRAGVVLARLGTGVTVRVIPELAEHPGAEDGPQSW